MSRIRIRAIRVTENSLPEIRRAMQRLIIAVDDIVSIGSVFIGKTTTLGPNGEAAYTNERHWVKEQNTSVNTGDATQLDLAVKTGGKWVRAENLTGEHAPDDSQIVVVEVITTGGTSAYWFWWTDGSTVGVTDTLTVVTDFNETTCVLTTQDWEFENGLLKSVT